MGWKRRAGETDSHWGASQKFRQQVMGVGPRVSHWKWEEVGGSQSHLGRKLREKEIRRQRLRKREATKTALRCLTSNQM